MLIKSANLKSHKMSQTKQSNLDPSQLDHPIKKDIIETKLNDKLQDDEEEEEELDPRVQDELEKLNKHTDEINKLELQLEDANCLFRTLLTDSTHQLKALSQKIGVAHIEKARPYFEALEIANKAQKECQSAATAFQRASGIHAAAKETIALAEERFLTNSSVWQFDNAWQEMLNHATMKVMQAEKLKTDSEAEHLQRAAFYTAAEQACQRLEKRLKKNVVKSQPYFEQKEAFNKALEAQKIQVQTLQTQVSTVKAEYAKSLRKLEEISESIHAQRKFKQKMLSDQRQMLSDQRQPGVGAELFDTESSNSVSASGNLSHFMEFDLDECCYERGSVVSGKSSSVGEEYAAANQEEESSTNHEPSYKISTNHESSLIFEHHVHRTVSCPEDMLKQLSLKSHEKPENVVEENHDEALPSEKS